MSQHCDSNDTKSILFIGTACQDIIITVPEYPKEDDFTRLRSIKNKRGGNASTAAVVYSLLTKNDRNKSKNNNNKSVYYMGTLPTKEKSNFIINDLKKYGNLNYDLCYFNPNNVGSISFVFHSLQNSSRTIVHQKERFELSFAQFYSQIQNKLQNRHDLSVTFDLIFFEFKWAKQMSKMIKYITDKYTNNQIKIAVEMETNRFKDKADWNGHLNELNETIERVLMCADIIFFSQNYVTEMGYSDSQKNNNNPLRFIKEFIIDKYVKKNNESYASNEKIIIIPWGAIGAWCVQLSDYENIIFCKAYAPPNGKVVDTLGAGDTFNGSFLFAYRKGWNMQCCCDFACKCAGYKVGFDGIDCIADFDVNRSKL